MLKIEDMDIKELTGGAPEYVPYIVHESDMARMERTTERLWKAIIILLVLFVLSNSLWIIYESQFEDIVVTSDVDTGNGDANVTGVGDITNGESKTDGTN